MVRSPAIFVIDDDPGVSRALVSVGQLLDLEVVAFSSATSYLEHFNPDLPGCVVLDIKMPEMTGLELLKEFASFEYALPTIVISGHADVPLTVEAMRRGAITLLEKPFRLDELTKYVRLAVELDRKNREKMSLKAKRESQLALLTQKEHEVLELVAQGKTNRQIASLLSISQRAVEDRRARLMRKVGARSVVELLELRRSQS